MDLRDFEPARTDRRLSGETAQAPALRHRVFFALVIFQLGAMSLAWALLAPLLSLLLPRAIAGRLGRAEWTLAYQSRSGSPRDPWLEPDVADVIRALARDGARDVVVVPVGFVCDHVEVLYDLDVEAKAVAESSGIGFHRAAAANDHPAFVAMLADLVRHGRGPCD